MDRIRWNRVIFAGLALLAFFGILKLLQNDDALLGKWHSFISEFAELLRSDSQEGTVCLVLLLGAIAIVLWILIRIIRWTLR